MKKLLFIFSVLSLLVYGCNRGEDTSPTVDKVEREEARPAGEGQSPGFEKEEYREYEEDETNVTTPIDDRPDLEEEE